MNDAAKVIETFELFKDKGWMPGNAGALALQCSITDNSRKIYITPNNSNRKKLTTNDLFLLRDLYGSQDIRQPINQADENLKLSDWSPTFLDIFSKYPEAKAIAQVITKWSALSARHALLAWKKTSNSHPNVLRLTHWPLLDSLHNTRELTIPIINYGDSETLLREASAMLSLYPETCVLLIRDYGAVVWGESLNDIENKIEILEHLCELQIYSYSLLSPSALV